MLLIFLRLLSHANWSSTWNRSQPGHLADKTGRYSPESKQRIDAHATVIRTLVESRTPGLGLGAQSRLATVSGYLIPRVKP